MQSRSKDDEVQFYLDRSKESIITILRSIIGNPRLDEAEQFRILGMIAEHHRAISGMIDQRLRAGEERGLQLAARVLEARQ